MSGANSNTVPQSATPSITFVDVLARQAAERPAQTAFVFLDEDDQMVSWSYAELSQRVRQCAAAISQTAEKGDRALLVYPPGLEFIAAFLGCLSAGVLPAPATYPKPRRPMPRLDAIAVDCAPNIALTTAGALATMQLDRQSPAVQSLRWIATDNLDQVADSSSPRLMPGDAAFLQYTSGSTSDPRGVVVSHSNLMHNLELIRQGFGIAAAGPNDPPSSGVFWLPAYHDMGLIGGVLTPIYVGGTSYLLAPAAFLRRPLVWLEWLSKTGAAISGAPNFAYDLCVDKSTPEQRAQLDLSRWELAFCGAEPVHHDTLHRFAESFEASGFSPAAHYPCYGLAEATLMVSGGRRAETPRVLSIDRHALAQNQVIDASNGDARMLVGCGSGLGDQQLQIVDPHTRRSLDERNVGEIWVRGDSVARRYWTASEDGPFDAELAAGDGGFLRTGDLGFLDQGELFVTGRLKDVIIIRGRNYYPQDVERTAREAHPAVDLGAAFACHGDGSDSLVVVHQVDRQHRRGDLDEVLRAIRTAVVEEHELDPQAIVLIKPASLPLTSSGKVQRSRCRELYEAGDLAVLTQWRQTSSDLASGGAQGDEPPAFLSRLDELSVEQTAAEVQAWMLGWLSQRLALPAGDMEPNSPFAELGIDSLTSVELALEFENVLGLRLAPAVAWSYPTPAELSVHLAEQLKGVDSPPTKEPTPA